MLGYYLIKIIHNLAQSYFIGLDPSPKMFVHLQYIPLLAPNALVWHTVAKRIFLGPTPIAPCVDADNGGNGGQFTMP